VSLLSLSLLDSALMSRMVGFGLLIGPSSDGRTRQLTLPSKMRFVPSLSSSLSI
jgi:hypothetical protein